MFDGVCNFCNGAVNFIIDHDRKDVFRFTALQSESGLALQKKFGFDPKILSTFILIENDRYYTKTTAALRVARDFGGFWKLLYIFVLVPPPLRNIAYNIIARYRYKWFGKKDVCRIPSPKEKAKFI
jgi:predicted DCC family thiol-disulfide oxidoreductase YuxK